MYLASLLGVPRPGPCAGPAGTAVSDFLFTDSLWQVITALSLLCATHAPETFSSRRLRHGGRCTVQQWKPLPHGQDPASAILPPGPMLC